MRISENQHADAPQQCYKMGAGGFLFKAFVSNLRYGDVFVMVPVL